MRVPALAFLLGVAPRAVFVLDPRLASRRGFLAIVLLVLVVIQHRLVPVDGPPPPSAPAWTPLSSYTVRCVVPLLHAAPPPELRPLRPSRGSDLLFPIPRLLPSVVPGAPVVPFVGPAAPALRLGRRGEQAIGRPDESALETSAPRPRPVANEAEQTAATSHLANWKLGASTHTSCNEEGVSLIVILIIPIRF